MKKGFTLIELLVVVLIIGILAAVALPQYEKAVTRSRLGTLKAIVESVIKNGEEYYLANGVYPKSVEDLTVQPPAFTSKKIEGNWEWYYYEWGHCRLDRQSSDSNFWCYNETSKIGYGARFLHSTSRPGQRACSVFYPRPAAAVSVCRADTRAKRTTNLVTSGDGLQWEGFKY
jgi:prepilin-type N-terminal cleavage/methylation domain-containing protein